MHRNICSSAGVSSLRVPLATTMAIAMAILASLGQASSMDGAIYSEETLDRIMPDQEIPLDALGYLGGLFEARILSTALHNGRSARRNPGGSGIVRRGLGNDDVNRQGRE